MGGNDYTGKCLNLLCFAVTKYGCRRTYTGKRFIWLNIVGSRRVQQWGTAPHNNVKGSKKCRAHTGKGHTGALPHCVAAPLMGANRVLQKHLNLRQGVSPKTKQPSNDPTSPSPSQGAKLPAHGRHSQATEATQLKNAFGTPKDT